MKMRKLGRTTDKRRALLRNLTTQLIIHGQIKTTEARAKDIRSTTEKMITLGKRGDLSARRNAASFLENAIASAKESGNSIKVTTALQKLFGALAKKYSKRNGGYTRTYKIMPRRGDGASMVLIQLV